LETSRRGLLAATGAAALAACLTRLEGRSLQAAPASETGATIDRVLTETPAPGQNGGTPEPQPVSKSTAVVDPVDPHNAYRVGPRSKTQYCTPGRLLGVEGVLE
jgi:hypothetical protein